MTGFVYFILRPSSERIKIGFSSDPERRLSELQTGSDERLELLACFDATPKVEREIHRYLDGSRHIGEWFDCTLETVRFMDRIRELLSTEAAAAMRHADALEAWGLRKFGKLVA